MDIIERLEALRQTGEELRWQVEAVRRVVKQTGLPQAINRHGALHLLQSLPGLRLSDPSLLFRLFAHNDPHRVGLIGVSTPHGGSLREDRAYSFHEIDERIDRIATALWKRGVRPGDRVLVMVKNRPEFVLLQAAGGRLGCAAVSVSYRSTPRELAYLAHHSGARALFFDVDVAEHVHEAAPDLSAIPRERCVAVGGEAPPFPALEDLLREGRGAPPRVESEPAVVMYTSGTTGKPKGAVRKFARGAMLSIFAFIGETPMQVGDVHLAACPLYHATAFGFVTISYILRSTVVVMREFRPEAFLSAIQRYRVTTTAVVPTMLHRLLELGEDRIAKYDLSSLKIIFSGGAQLSPSLAADVLRVFGDKLYNFYGSTETGLVTLAKPEDLRAAPGTIGRALPGCDVRLYDDRGRICGTNEVGELYAKSPLLIAGYHEDDAATAQSMRDGYFSVGDLGRRDERGLLFIEGRKRDMIISGGVNVYPAEVEAALDEHPAVAEAAVVGVTDETWGERVRAYVVKKPGAALEAEELIAYAKERLSGPKVPKEIVFLDALPRNPTGKVLKRELK